MSFVSDVQSNGLLKASANYLTSFIESDSGSDSEGFESIESTQSQVEFHEAEPYHIPIHFLHIPIPHAQSETVLPIIPITNTNGIACSDERPPHVCQSRNGEYFLRCIQGTRCKLVTISSRGMFLLQESPSNFIGSELRSIITKAENIALITMGEFQQLCRDNMHPVRGKKRPLPAELESEWCKISRSVTELHKRFEEVDGLYDGKEWKEPTD